MTLIPIRICYPFVGDSVGGSHISALLLIEGLDRNRFDPQIVVHEEGPLTDHLKALGLPFELLYLPVYAGETSNLIAIATSMLRNLPRLAGYIRRHSVDIIHANDLRMNLTWSIAAKITRRPFVWHQRSLPYSSSPLWRLVGLLSDHVIYISDSVDRALGAMGRTPTSIINNSVSLWQPASSRRAAKLAIARKLNLDPSTTIVGFVGRLVELKRLDIFVSASTRIARQCNSSSIAFIVVGHDEGLLIPQLRSLATSMEIEDQIYFVGFRRRIEEWISGMDVLMATSDREGFGRSLIEAMILGTPVVAAGAAGHLEIIDHERTGLLVAPNDPDAFAAAVGRILADIALAGRLAEEGRTCAVERYSVERHVCRIASIYDSLL